MLVCLGCGQSNPDGARFCMACASLLPGAEPAPHGARKTVTVVFCDVAGSTMMAERLDPESVREVMSRFFREMRSVLEFHGGTVEKFIGDAVMAVFGDPAASRGRRDPGRPGSCRDARCPSSDEPGHPEPVGRRAPGSDRREHG